MEILAAHALPGGLEVSYQGVGPGSLALDDAPYQVRLETGEQLPVERCGEEAVMMVPRGRHTLTITQAEPWHWGVGAASFYCSTGITVLAGSAGFAANTFETSDTTVIGVRSRSMS